MKKIILLSLVLLSLILLSTSVLAQVQIINPLSSPDFSSLLTKISTGVAGLVGTLSGIMIIIAGIMYLTSAGDPQKITLAKTALKYAIMGIVIAIVAIPIVDTIMWVLGVRSTP